MKIKNCNPENKHFIFIMFVFLCFFLTACYNPIMEKWWPEPKEAPPPVIEQSGVNFAVVFLDARGGAPQPYPLRVLWGNTVPRIRAMTHSDPTLGFAGWLDEYGNPWDIETRSVKKEDDKDGDGIITLTAQWATQFVTVEFQTNYDQIFAPGRIPRNQFNEDIVDSGGVLLTIQKIVPGSKIVEPPTLRTDGIHGLLGWFTQDGDRVTNESELYSVNWNDKWNFSENLVAGPGSRTMTLYARWSTYSRTIHLQVNGGTRPNGQELTRVNFTVFAGLGGSPGGKIIDPGPLVREGYTFEGWFTEGGAPWNFTTDLVKEVDNWVWNDDLKKDVLENEAFILHARWTPNIYYVTFSPGGGLPAPARQEIKHGDRVTIPPPMSYLDMAFNGWIDESDNAWNFDRGVTRTMTLYATWVPRQYTVKFHLGVPPGGLNPVFTKPADQLVTQFATEPYMPALPAGNKTNYSFLGWYSSTSPSTDTNPDIILNENEAQRDVSLIPWYFTTLIRSSNTNSDGVLNLYARWAGPDPDMVWVPKGSFVMGDAGVSGSPATYHAYPTRRVTLDGFFMSRYEVTQVNSPDSSRGYQLVMGINPSQFYRNDVRPVERVSWFDAIEYCNRLTDLEMPSSIPGQPSPQRVYTWTSGPVLAATFLAGTGSRINSITGVSGAFPIVSGTVTADFSKRGYRLPTEAEWEYAARGGNNSPGNYAYAGSDNPDLVSWYTTTVSKPPAEGGSSQTVGRLAPNNLGLYDMSGNASEWVWDWFMPYKDYIASNPADLNINPKGPASGDQRIRRGGAWNNAASNVRSVVRNSDVPSTATWVIGFRVVRGPSQIW